MYTKDTRSLKSLLIFLKKFSGGLFKFVLASGPQPPCHDPEASQNFKKVC